MARFVAMSPPEGGAERAVVLRDGFSWLAFILPVFWLLWHRLWIEAAAVFAATLGIGTLGEIFQAPSAAVLLTLLVQWGVGLEGQNWRAARLRRRGWREIEAVEAQDMDEAEARLFAAEAPVQPAPDAPPLRRSFGRPAPAAVPLGLLGYRG